MKKKPAMLSSFTANVISAVTLQSRRPVKANFSYAMILDNSPISNGLYDIPYLEAIFLDDEEEINYIEEAVFGLGFGPLAAWLAECKTACNVSSKKTFCTFVHGSIDGELDQSEMETIACDVKFNAYVAFEEYRRECPQIKAVVKGVHFHPIPQPTKTPKDELIKLLPRFQEDLPDLTLRRFLRHPIIKAYLAAKFPNIINPTLISDLHISLANRAHLKTYIDQVRKEIFPYGTDWMARPLHQRRNAGTRSPFPTELPSPPSPRSRAPSCWIPGATLRPTALLVSLEGVVRRTAVFVSHPARIPTARRRFRLRLLSLVAVLGLRPPPRVSSRGDDTGRPTAHPHFRSAVSVDALAPPSRTRSLASRTAWISGMGIAMGRARQRQ
ncbi:hypothetical protein C8J57DRAFT_1530888 [Mycena rebaudengoi]|nr:hypothetical protein C8J57DRAFT_1530888 [Mycena rebaudengoi]